MQLRTHQIQSCLPFYIFVWDNLNPFAQFMWIDLTNEKNKYSRMWHVGLPTLTLPFCSPVSSLWSLHILCGMESPHPVWHAVDTKERAKHGQTATPFLLSKSKIMGEALTSFIKLQRKLSGRKFTLEWDWGKASRASKLSWVQTIRSFLEPWCGCRRAKRV